MKRASLPSSILIVASLFFFVIGVNKSFAVTTSITNAPSSITADPFSLTITVSGATTGTNYLRVDLYKDGTNNYFGETYSGSNWYAGSEHTQYFPITITPGTDWTGSLQGKFGSPTTTDYDGTGSYKLRVRRYTGSGSYNSTEANNGAVAITINIPTPTSVPTSTPTIAPTATPQNTPTPAKTPTPAPTSTPTKTPTPSPTVTKIPTISQAFVQSLSQKVEAEDTIPTSILGDKATPTPSLTPTITPQPKKSSSSFNIVSLGFIGIGILALGASSFLIIKMRNTDI